MMLNSISFGAVRRVDVSPSLKVKNATAAQIAQTINSAHSVAGQRLGVENLKPSEPVTGKSLVANNHSCFNSDKKLNNYGCYIFDREHKDLGVSSENNMGDYSKAISNFIVRNYSPQTKEVDRAFDIWG